MIEEETDLGVPGIRPELAPVDLDHVLRRGLRWCLLENRGLHVDDLEWLPID